jgi:quinol monooxygenase YgiN
MSNSKPVGVTVIYRVKQGKEADFTKLIKKHAPALKASGLITPEPVRLMQAKNVRNEKSIVFIETFQWKDDQASNVAHQTPEIISVWEPMGPLLENLEIFHVEAVN